MAYTPERLHWNPLTVGNTRSAAWRGVPFVAIGFIFGIPVLLCVCTFNPFWIIYIPIAWTLIKRWCASNPNKPREWWISIRTGSIFASRSVWGGESISPHEDG